MRAPPHSWWWSAGLAGLVALGWPVPAAAQETTRPREPRTASLDAVALYAGACASCHGLTGDGKGPGAAQLGSPQPRDFTAGVYKFRSTPTSSAPTIEDLSRTISRGIPGTWMPAWRDLLSEAQIRALAEYVIGFAEVLGWDEPEAPLELPSTPPFTDEHVREGRLVYAALGCGRCHGLEGRGDGPSSDDLEDDWGRPIRAYDFTRGQYRSGSSPVALYRSLVTGLSGTPMPALEEQAVLFPGGPAVPTSIDSSELPPGLREEVGRYLAEQPTAARLESMSIQERTRLVQRRLWALVAYVRSLERKGGLLQWLLRDNPDLGVRGRTEP